MCPKVPLVVQNIMVEFVNLTYSAPLKISYNPYYGSKKTPLRCLWWFKTRNTLT